MNILEVIEREKVIPPAFEGMKRNAAIDLNKALDRIAGVARELEAQEREDEVDALRNRVQGELDRIHDRDDDIDVCEVLDRIKNALWSAKKQEEQK